MIGIQDLSVGFLTTACELTVNSEEKNKSIIIGKNLKVCEQWASPVAKVVKKKKKKKKNLLALRPFL